MPLDKASISQYLAAAGLPAESVLNIAACDGRVALRLRAASPETARLEAQAAAIHQLLSARAAPEALVSLAVEYLDQSQRPIHTASFQGAANVAEAGHRPISGLAQPAAAPDIRHIIAVGAGKGGVGKSSVAVNLAVGLARRGHAVGLLDGDIYGPSIPTMLGLHSLEQAVVAGRLQPFLVHGVKAITIGKLVDPDKPLIWRGPMAHGAFKQLLEQTSWGELDYLIIDLPPGTGDVSLTMAQSLHLTGAVVVCTPQRVAQDDALRAARMFQQLNIDVLGVVENMSYFVGDDGKEYDLFGRGGAERMAARLNLPFLGAVPITTSLRVNSDAGDPTANFEGDTRLRRALEGLVEAVEKQAALAAVRQGRARPTLRIS